MENGGYRSFDIVVYNLILFYHGYIWDSIGISTNISNLTLEKTPHKPKLYCTLPSSA